MIEGARFFMTPAVGVGALLKVLAVAKLLLVATQYAKDSLRAILRVE